MMDISASVNDWMQ